jgi:ParB family chromosome partitioning protein
MPKPSLLDVIGSRKVKPPSEISDDETDLAYQTMFGLNTTNKVIPHLKSPQDSEYAIVQFSLMDDFPGHPFRLYEGEREADMVDSIRQKGILQPLILRDMCNGRYQILSGHNRKYSGLKAGLTEGPALIKRNLSDDDAWMYVIETNLMKRSFADMAHSEKAAVIATHHSKLFSQGKRNDILSELEMLEKLPSGAEHATIRQVGKRFHSDELISTIYGLSSRSVSRYIRIHKLVPCFKDRLNKDEIAFIPAVTLSFLKEAEQRQVDQCINMNGFKVDMVKANLLRHYAEAGKLDEDSVYAILSGEAMKKPKPNRTPTIKVSKSVYVKYFRPDQPAKEIQSIVEKALALYFSHQ